MFKARHIDGLYPFHTTDPMKRGLVVDHILTEPGTPCPYELKIKKTDDPLLYKAQKYTDERFLVPESYWNEANEIIDHIKKQPYWLQGIDTAIFQLILEGQINNTLFCGKPDRIDELTPDAEGRKQFHIQDLKIVSAMKISSDAKWLWNAIEMGYIRQLAVYQYMLAQKHGIPVENIICSHIAVAHVEDGFVKSQLYRIPQTFLDEAMNEVDWAVTQIEAKKFDEPMTTWSDVHTLSHFKPADDSDEEE